MKQSQVVNMALNPPEFLFVIVRIWRLWSWRAGGQPGKSVAIMGELFALQL